jgi:CheY-like chemotaxis protein
MHFLIIEDDLLLAMDLQDILADLGSRTTAVASTEEQAFKSALAQRPDLIVSDVRLAEGTGPKAIQRIREALGTIPAIYVTASPERARAEDPEAPILSKPFLPEQLAEAKLLVMRASEPSANLNV